jgi:hypothetical protein
LPRHARHAHRAGRETSADGRRSMPAGGGVDSLGALLVFEVALAV